MKNLALKIFHLKSGEEGKTLLLTVLMFFSSLAAFCGYFICGGLIVDSLGAQEFPQVYVFQATVFLLIFPILFMKALKGKIQNIFLTLLSFSCILCLISSIYFSNTAIRDIPSVAWFLVRSTFYMLFIHVSGSFWFFIDRYYKIDDAKRVYGIFQGAFLSTPLFGSLILSAIDIDKIWILFSILFVIASISLVLGIYIKYKLPIENSTTKLSTKEEKFSIKNTIKSLFFSPLFSIICFANLLNKLLDTLVESSYIASFEKYFEKASSTNYFVITNFMIKITLIMSIINIVISSCFYGRLIKKLGIRVIIFIPTTMFTIFFSISNNFPPLPLGLFGFFICEGILDSIEENNFNLIIKNIPTHAKYLTAIFADSLAETFGVSFGYLCINNYYSKLLICITLAIFVTIIGKVSTKHQKQENAALQS